MSFFENAAARLYFRPTPDAPEQSLVLPPRPGVIVSPVSDLSLSWARQVEKRRLRGTLKHEGGAGVRLERLELALVAGAGGAVLLDEELDPETGYVLYRHGYQSWSDTGLQKPDESDHFAILKWKHAMDENPEVVGRSVFGPQLPGAFFPAKGFFHSDTFLGLESAVFREAAVFFGVDGPGQQFVRFRVQFDPASGRLREFRVIWDFNGQLFDAHSILALTPVASDISRSTGEGTRPAKRLADLLDDNMRRVGENFETPRFAREVYAGWCSWYHYYTKIDEKIIQANLQRAVDMNLGLDVFQIDDGYQKNVGDWTERADLFPAGMRALAAEIKKKKMIPGIWLAPFICHSESELKKRFPELVLRRGGKPVRALYNPNWGGWTYCLDVTHPHFEEWLRSVIYRYVEEWGYEYLKLDFLFAAAFRGDHHDPRTTGATRVRHGLNIIRKIAGKKTILVGCGCPLLAGMGMVDIQRIGMDVNEVWDPPLLGRLLRDRNFPTARGAMKNSITRAMLHRRFWNNDPDCLLFRQEKTSLSERQILLMASVVCLSGGMMFISDDLALVEGHGREILGKALELFRRAAPHTSRPVGLTRWHFPRALYNPGGFLGIWNPTPRPERVRLDVSAFMDEARVRGAVNYWSGEKIPWSHAEGFVEIALAPFESFVARLD